MSILTDDQYLRVQTAAVAISATEVALFAVHETVSATALTNVLHIRPGRFEQKGRPAAEAAFREIIAGCLTPPRDVAIEIADSGPYGPRFCLVHLGRVDERVGWTTAFITRCRHSGHALEVLEQLRSRRMFL